MLSVLCSMFNLILSSALARAAQPDRIALSMSLDNEQRGASPAVETTVAFPGHQDFFLHLPSSKSWVDVSAIEFDIPWPGNAPTNAQVLCHMADRDRFWYQQLLDGHLACGATNRLAVKLTPVATGWRAVGHRGEWHFRALKSPKRMAVRIFSGETFRGSCRIDAARAVITPDTAPVLITDVRGNRNHVPCFGKFELTFRIPDRYADPFDPQKIDVFADFRTPSGAVIRIDGYYGRDYFRSVDATGEQLYPQAAPYWRIRFAPTATGEFSYTITARDARGETQWGPATFKSVPSRKHGFVRVSAHDPRYFEFDDGSPFFPIGHNIRSPFDSRMDDQFPWRKRWIDGSSVYTHYFERMRAHGENITEIWSSAWSLGIEWSPQWRGFHGVGEYNMMNAWEMDRVVEEAERNGIQLNLVILNHGKFSLHWDTEWEHNPYNRALGGYLDDPEQFFTNGRARRDFLKLMRYIIARWGYSTSIFAWQLWNELDLVGNDKEFGEIKSKFYFKPQAVEWHVDMGRAVRDIDPYDHLVSTHVCTDYSRQNPAIIKLPEVSLAAVDAYHSTPEIMSIVTLLHKTADHNNPFGKPVLVTEFGGSAYGHGVNHLRNALHVALWSSTCIPLGGAPMFWWWQLVDEENFYPQFKAVANFMRGEDRRDPQMLMRALTLKLPDRGSSQLGAECLASSTRAYGWIYSAAAYARHASRQATPVSGLTVSLSTSQDATFDVEFWDTSQGKRVARTTAETEDGAISFRVPAFEKDIAFKVKKRRPAAAPAP